MIQWIVSNLMSWQEGTYPLLLFFHCGFNCRLVVVKYLFVPEADSHASDGDDASMIQPVRVKLKECWFGDGETERFGVNAGKRDSKISAFFTYSCTQNSLSLKNLWIFRCTTLERD